MENFLYELFGIIENIPKLYIYIFTFLSGLIQVAFPPYPGELVVALAGCIQAKKQILESLVLFFTYWSAIVAANCLLYEFGRRNGGTVLKNRFVSRFITLENKEKIEAWMSRFGIFVFLVAIYIPGLYLPVVYFSGVLKFNRQKALPGMMLATAVHDILLFMGGRFAGNNLAEISSFLTIYRKAAITIATGLILTYAAFALIKYFRKRSSIAGS